MSDPFLENIGLTEADLIRNVVANTFILDFGIVTAVNGTTVDVQHAIQPTRLGKQLPPTVTKGVEVMWPGTAQFNPRFVLSVGDTVLLIGLKDYVKTLQVSVPDFTDVPLHYTQETMKAIPVISTQGSNHVVTYAELNTALQTFLTALKLHLTAAGDPASGTLALDISASEYPTG
jgi:hypothetical protein